MAFSPRKAFSFCFWIMFLGSFAVMAVIYIQLRDLDNVKGMVVEQLRHLTGRNVSLSMAELDLTEGVGLKLHRVALLDPTGEGNDFTADQVSVTVQLLALLNWEVLIDKVVVEGSTLQVMRDRKGVYHFGSVDMESQDAKPTDWTPILSTGLLDRLELRRGTLRFSDYSLSKRKPPVEIQVNNLNLSLSHPLYQSRLLFSLDGEIPAPGKVASQIAATGHLMMSGNHAAEGTGVEARVHVDKLYLPPLAPYLDKVFAFLPNERWMSLETEVKGTFGESVRAQGKLGMAFQLPSDGPMLVALPSRTQGSLTYDIRFEKETIRFDKLDFTAADFHLETNGVFANYKSNNPKVFLSTSASSFDVEKSNGLLPFMLFHAEAHKRFREHFHAGHLGLKSLSFKGSLNQLNHLSDPENLKRLSGEFNLKNVTFGPGFPGLENVDGTLKFKNGSSTVQVTRARYASLSITNLSGQIKDVMTTPTVDWLVEGKFDLADIRQTLSQLMDPGTYEKELKLIRNLTGSGKARIRFRGPLLEQEKLSVAGKFELDNASFKKTDMNIPFEQVKGTIEFNNELEIPEGEVTTLKGPRPWHVKLNGFSGQWGNHTFSEVTAETTLEEETPIHKASGKIKLGTLEAGEWLPDTIKGPFRDFLKQVTFTGGEVEVEFREEANPLALVSRGPMGFIKMKKVSLKHKAGYRPLINVSGRMIMEPENILLQTSEAWYGDSPVTIKGEFININSKNTEVVLRASSTQFKHSDFADLPFLEALAYDGPAKVEFIWNSTERFKKFENHVDLTQASYTLKDVLHKPKGMPNKLEVHGELEKGGGLLLNNLVYEIEKNIITGRAHIKNQDQPFFIVKLSSKDFQTLPLASHLSFLEGNRSGKIDFDVSGKGNVKHLNEAVYSGRFLLKDLEFKPDSFTKAFKINARLNLDGDWFRVRDGQFTSDKSKVKFAGQYRAGIKPKLNLKVVGPRLDIDELVAENGTPNENADTPFLRRFRLLTEGSGKLDMELDQFNYKFWTLKPVVAKLTFRDQEIHLDTFESGKPSKNLVRAQGKYSFHDPKQGQFESLIIARNIRAEGFLSMFGGKFKNSLTGKMNWFKAKLNSRGNNLKQVFKNLEGDLGLDLEKGNLQTALLRDGVNKLFSFPYKIKKASLEKPHEPYVNIMGDFVIHKGLAQTENFLYEDKGQRMSLVGDFDLGRFQMDTVVGVAPLRELDKFLTKIPLVGKILTAGDEESLFKNYYTVKGGFSNPDVQSVPFTSLGKKVVGIFQGIIQTPTELFPEPSKP